MFGTAYYYDRLSRDLAISPTDIIDLLKSHDALRLHSLFLAESLAAVSHAIPHDADQSIKTTAARALAAVGRGFGGDLGHGTADLSQVIEACDAAAKRLIAQETLSIA